MPPEPKQTAAREIIEEAAIELGHFHFAWHIPELRHADVPVIDVLSVMLGGGRSSRLYQQVRERQGVVHHVDAWTYSPGLPGVFGMSAIVDGDKFVAARDAMLAEVEKLKVNVVSADELHKAVKQFVSATLSTRKTMEGQAQNLGGNWIAANDLNFSERYLAAVKRVSLADIQRVARHYLTAENRTLFALLPTGATPKAKAETSTSKETPIQKIELPNGLKLLLKQDSRLPFVEFRAVLQGGVLAETPANNGITRLFASMLLKGTAKLFLAEKIATEIESIGGQIDTYGGNQSFGANLEVLSSDFAIGPGFTFRRSFEPDVFRRLNWSVNVKFSWLASQRAKMICSKAPVCGDAPRVVRSRRIWLLDSLGNEETVSKISAADLRAFHQKLTVPNNCVLAIYGDIDIATVKEAVQRAFGTWRRGEGVKLQAAAAPALAINHIEEKRDKKQAVLVIGFRGTTIQDDDHYALELIHESCSDLGSRLFLRIREQLGLAYYCGAQNFAGVVPGYFAFYTGTEPSKADLVEKELLKEAELLRTEGLSAEELKRAKAKMVGQKKIHRQDIGNLASITALDELFGLGYQHSEHDDAKFEAVTPDQIKAAAQKYLKPDAYVVSVVKP